ncbi:gamma-glutamyltransferase [Paenibacillus whitsoniae]|uniref:Glutathione hydrolase proenzyme n=1 Tax=Paenibacillus whitsoniae TaxID=2496558 RepID=A0A430JL67_9BACL|nr:gamma-glutamyltransferase [Paenibacillus whitsoniae]RTE11768.1 gamma-glutamyltransferase [Paenibacillus whitsoniae]
MQQPMIGTKTMVVSPHYLASAAGARMLERGGNAFDAAVAVSACLAVVYPHMTGLGGDSFWLMYSQHDRAVRAYNASGRSGYRATRSFYAGEAAIPQRGVRSVVTVPGMVDGWDAVLREYGTLPLAEVLAPAIGYAEHGFPLSRDQHRNTAERLAVLAALPETAAVYLPGGAVPAQGARFVQRDLARTLRTLAGGGRDSFYKGEIGGRIASFLAGEGGLLTPDDWADHAGNWEVPLHGTYRGLDLYQVPPNSQGFTGIMTPQILENFNFGAQGGGIAHGSFDYYHLQVEALKLAFQDRNRVLTDPAFASIPVQELISKAYCDSLAARIDPKRASALSSAPVGSDTAYAAVVDAAGNSVSFIQSLYFEFGSGVTAGDTGVLLQNRGSFFSLDPGHVNTLEPRKRTFHTLMPAMAMKAGEPYLLYGTQGGEGQPQTQSALLTRIVDYRMDPQQAVSEPRWVWGRTWGAATQELKIESRVPEAVRVALADAGHDVRTVGAYDGVVGHAHAIVIDERGFRSGGTDPRCDGQAIGW